jgi:IMP dehydrogenase
MKEFGIGGIPIVDENQILKGIVTNRDLRFERNNTRPIVEVMTSENLCCRRYIIRTSRSSFARP